MKIGDWVVYYGGYGVPEVGKVKSIDGDIAFVVYHCNDKWDDFKNYTGASSSVNLLTVITATIGGNDA